MNFPTVNINAAIVDATPYGQLPTLEFDGKKHAQSLAIARYLGRKYAIAGDTLEEDLEIDKIVEFVNDIRAKAASVHYEKNEPLKEEKHANFSVNEYPKLLEKLNEIAGQNKGHLALERLTWGDFILAGIYDYLKVMLRNPNVDTEYPNLKKVVDNVHAVEKLQSYLATRPVTEI